MADPRRAGLLEGPGVMLLSAAIFGYFGFFIGLTGQTAAGQTVFFFSLLVWTLRVSAIGFIVSALLTFVQPIAANLLYAVIGLGAAIGFAVVGIMDLMDAQHGAAVPPILAFLFAAWNGYGAWSGLRCAMAAMQLNQSDHFAPDG